MHTQRPYGQGQEDWSTMAIRKSGTREIRPEVIELDEVHTKTASKGDTLADEGLEEQKTARNYEDE